MPQSFGWTHHHDFSFISSGSINHLFDQMGNHSPFCKCHKLKQDLTQKTIFDKNQANSIKISQAPKKKQKLPPPPLTRMDTINQFISKLNQLILITLKATDSINPLALGAIKKLGQEIGIKWQNYLDAKFIKSKDFVTFLKSKIYVLLNGLLMKNNIGLFD
jgi:hypothetical protein